jgi:hypothetical protein
MRLREKTNNTHFKNNAQKNLIGKKNKKIVIVWLRIEPGQARAS